MKWVDRSRKWIKVMFLFNVIILTCSFISSYFIPVFILGMFGLGWCVFNYYANRESMKNVETNYLF